MAWDSRLHRIVVVHASCVSSVTVQACLRNVYLTILFMLAIAVYLDVTARYVARMIR